MRIFAPLAALLSFLRNDMPRLPGAGLSRSFGSSQQQQSYNRFASAYANNEIVFAAIEMLATSAGEPHIVGRKWRRESPRIGRTTGPTGAIDLLQERARPLDARSTIRNEEERMRGRGLSIRAVKEHMIQNGFFKELPAHPLVTLLRRPNPWLSRGQLWGTVVMDRCLAGNSYLFKARFHEGPMKGAVAELWRLRPDRVKIIPSATDFIEAYEYGEGNDKVRYKPEDIVHFKTRNPFDDYYGMPPLLPISGRVGIDDFMKNFLRTFFERGGAGPGSVLSVKQKLSQESKDEIRLNFQSQFSGAGGPHKLLVLDQAEATYTPLSMNRGIRDALPKEIDAVNEARIAMVFGIPGSLLGLLIGYESSSYANKRQDWQVLWDLTMTPLLSDLDDALNLQLVPDFGGIDEVLFDLSDIRALQEDVDLVQKRVRENVASGLMAWEEGQEAIGLDPTQNEGKTYFIPIVVNPTPGELVPLVAPPGSARWSEQKGGADAGVTEHEHEKEHDDEREDEDEPAATDLLPMYPTAIVAEVHCPKCDRWLGRNINVGATALCPNCKEVRIEASPVTVVKTVERDDAGRVAKVTEVRS